METMQTETTTTTNIRRDGLSIGAAASTAEYVLGRHFRLTTVRAGAVVRTVDAVTDDQAREILEILSGGHGLGVSFDDRCAIVDVSTCPADATPGERESLANRLAEQCGSEARTSAREDGDDVEAAGERAADEEFRWCMQQTLPFLEHRLGRRVGDGGETRCGDWLRAGSRRLCGECSILDRAGDGCGEVLERHDQ